MFAVLAAVLFAIALLLQWIDESVGDVITSGTLTTAGLLFLAVHLAGPTTGTGRGWRGWSSRWRR